MRDDTKDRDDPAHQTMPPELRPFAKPEPRQPLVAPEGEARFNAAIGALKLLNGGPAVDPFYVDPKNDPALAERKAPESVKAYAPPTAVAAAEAAVRQAAPAKVVIAEAVEAPRGGIHECQEVDLRPLQAALEAHRAAEASKTSGAAGAGEGDVARDEGARAEGDAPPETPASPWAKEAPPQPAEEAALPSSFRPLPAGDASRVTQPSLRKLAPVPSPTRRIVLAIVIAIVAAVVALWALVTRGPEESATHGPPRMTTATVPALPVAAVAPPRPTASAQDPVPFSPSATSSAPPAPSVGPAPDRSRQGSRRPQKGDDPYDAAAPLPPVTAAPSTTPSAAPPPAAVPSVTASAAPTAPPPPFTPKSAAPPPGPMPMFEREKGS